MGSGTVLIGKTYDEFSLQDFVDCLGLLAEKKAKKKVHETVLWHFFHSPPWKKISVQYNRDGCPPPPPAEGFFWKG